MFNIFYNYDHFLTLIVSYLLLLVKISHAPVQIAGFEAYGADGGLC